MSRFRGRAGWIGAALLAFAATGCAGTTGVDIQNRTDRVLRVEWLDVSPTGTAAPYSTGTLARGASFQHQIAREQRGDGKRVRFTLADEPVETDNDVVLHVPEERSRDFDLVMVDGRLMAREHKRGRDYGRDVPGEQD